jgi:hypothetical protein
MVFGHGGDSKYGSKRTHKRAHQRRLKREDRGHTRERGTGNYKAGK